MKKSLYVISSLLLMSTLFACSSLTSTESTSNSETTSKQSTKETSEQNSVTSNVTTSHPTTTSNVQTTLEGISGPTFDPIPTGKVDKPTLYLAGDSTVKTYADNQFIGGWGQYLNLFLNQDVTVSNCANGGRSSRSFINEGRLYDDEDASYTFSENNGNSIGDVIKSGDFLLIQFGHNDDDTKIASQYSNVYNRMVPLGEPDENGIYPTTAGVKYPTTYLPEIYTTHVKESEVSSAKTEIAKYGTHYYSYDSGGTYKWFLKQYVDFARSKGAIPVLVTPVPRIKFSGNTIVGGEGLHGEDFAYVKAVRQLAEETDCLLIDLFSDVKEIVETATPTYVDSLMALKPNSLTGTWPLDYDKAYKNPDLGYTGIEATHYNKYGAFLTAAKVAEAIKTNTTKHNQEAEYFYFAEKVNNTPSTYIDPSNLMAKSVVSKVEKLFTTCDVINPNRTYPDFNVVVTMINDLQALGEVTNDNYLEFKTKCEAIRDAYNGLNVDDRPLVTNISVLEEYETKVAEFIELNRPKPTSTTVITFDEIQEGIITEAVEYNGVKVVATSTKSVSYKPTAAVFNHNGESYNVAGALSMGGSAKFGEYRYIEFTTTGKCTITIAAQSSSKTADRLVSMVKSSATSTVLKSFDAKASLSLSSFDTEQGDTYQIGSASSGVYIFAIIVEYFD